MYLKEIDNSAIFDKHGSSYIEEVDKLTRIVGRDANFFTKVKAGHIINFCQKYFGSTKKLKVLDIGCGIGTTDSLLKDSFGELYGIDVSENSLNIARKTNPDINYVSYDGVTLPYAAESFDISIAICVLHHVAANSWNHFLGEMARVTKPGGLTFIFEHNPFNPLTQLTVHRCEFDKDAILLSATQVVRLYEKNTIETLEKKYILYVPWHSPMVNRLEGWMNWVPLGAQYYVAGKKT